MLQLRPYVAYVMGGTNMESGALASAIESLPGNGHVRVLVIDDEAVIREVAASMLKHIGCEVAVTEDGAKAVELYEKALDDATPFDAVITDLMMPGGMDGHETAKRVRAINPDAKIIVSTGYGAQFTEEDHLRNGFCAVINKPYTIEDLSDVLRGVGLSAAG